MRNYVGRRPRRPWTDAEIAEARRLRRVLKWKYCDIDRALDRPGGATERKLAQLDAGDPGRRIYIVPTILSPAQIAERDRRNAARNRQYETDITATLFGDPPPGFSALDRMRKDTRS